MFVFTSGIIFCFIVTINISNINGNPMRTVIHVLWHAIGSTYITAG